MRALITGSGGMLGRDMYKAFSAVHEVKATDVNLNEPWLEQLDITNYAQCFEVIQAFQPDIVLHLAALTDLEYCEVHPEDSWRVNALGTENIALICKQLDIRMVYISTSAVFDGSQDVFTDFDTPNPLNHYGKGKLYGERIVQQLVDKFYIFRMGWTLGGEEKDVKFLKNMLDQVRNGATTLYGVGDRSGSLTYTRDFAAAVLKIVETDMYGLYNQVCTGFCSRYDVAVRMNEILGLGVEVKKVTTDYFKTEYFAPRPRSENLLNLKLNARGMNYMRDWETCLEEYLLSLHIQDLPVREKAAQKQP